MARLREGRSYEEIAEAEGLSRERVRQIVVETLSRRHADAQRDHAHLQMLRLAPALRLAAKEVAEGDRRAIADLVRVLDRLDKYQAVGAAAEPVEYQNIHQRLMNKFNTALARMDAERSKAEEAEGSDAEPEEGAPDEAAAAEGGGPALPWGLKP